MRASAGSRPACPFNTAAYTTVFARHRGSVDTFDADWYLMLTISIA